MSDETLRHGGVTSVGDLVVGFDPGGPSLVILRRDGPEQRTVVGEVVGESAASVWRVISALAEERAAATPPPPRWLQPVVCPGCASTEVRSLAPMDRGTAHCAVCDYRGSVEAFQPREAVLRNIRAAADAKTGAACPRCGLAEP